MNVSRLVELCHVSSEATNGGFPEKKTLRIMVGWAWLVSTIFGRWECALPAPQCNACNRLDRYVRINAARVPTIQSR